jgi:hypothetical protein
MEARNIYLYYMFFPFGFFFFCNFANFRQAKFTLLTYKPMLELFKYVLFYLSVLKIQCQQFKALTSFQSKSK